MHLDLSPKPETPLSETHEPIRTIGLEVHFAIMTPAGGPRKYSFSGRDLGGISRHLEFLKPQSCCSLPDQR